MGTDETARSSEAVEGYIDLYLLPVPEENLDAYRRQATIFGTVVKEHGGLGYREFRGDDLREGFSAEPGVMLTTAVAEFRSRAHRDEVMAKVLEDPRIKGSMDGDQLADMGQMQYGGFRTFVAP
ncbi:MAG: hypothetical protein AVDCRST_MAG79-1401 [uncultured Thermoleophilia bacterium]|uniref:DUF1428 domain-containing protein n=1 Tax=uncultured Thermoleophilia bacterium TaxID=1497501 RepID=A0A6J4U1D1_9ACTN|nr:MAG: hypothetical protein AVDCRST_MAG79-1401 [uncultured Thermoleophilia bacterium]